MYWQCVSKATKGTRAAALQTGGTHLLGAGAALCAGWWRLLRDPSGGAAWLAERPLAPGALAAWVAALGLVRGALEGYWLYLATGREAELLAHAGTAAWYLRLAGPFLLVNAASALFLWYATAWILYGAGRVLGGQGRLDGFLRVVAPFLVWYPLIGAVNYLHLWWPLPAITLRASAFYQPILGTGQILALAALLAVGYAAGRRLHGLVPVEAALAAALPVLVTLCLYTASAAFLFRWAFRWAPMPAGQIFFASNLAYLAVTGALTAAMAWLARPAGDQGP